VIDPADILEHPTSSRFSILRSAEGNNVIGDYIGDLLLRLPRVWFAIERVKKQTFDLGKVSISLSDLRFMWWVIDHEEGLFRYNCLARVDDGGGSEAHTLFIDFRLADATFGNWIDWVGNCGAKKGDVV
jgi:hypothetical protein